MREWPRDNKPADFEHIVQPIVDAVHHAYLIKRQNQDSDIPYRGFNIGRSELACCLDPVTTLSQANLAISLDDQGRDALTEIISIAVRLGIEQGRRIVQPELTMLRMLARASGFLDNSP